MNISPMQWSKLKDISEVRPVDATDEPCLNDIRAVLDKHGCLDRFGVALLHSHFDIADDEILLETTDEEKREHWVRPVKKKRLEEAGLDAQTTVLSFNESGYEQNCACARNSHGHSGGAYRCLSLVRSHLVTSNQILYLNRLVIWFVWKEAGHPT